MGKFKLFMPCEEANHTCDKSQYKEASLLEKMKLNFHLIYCKACRKYTKNNAKLTKKMKASKVQCLDKKEKQAIKKEFDKALHNQSNH